MEAPSFDDLLGRLSALALPFEAKAVEDALDLAFARDPDLCTAQIEVWIGRPCRPGGILRLAELRFFKRHADEVVLGLHLAEDAAIAMDEVARRFGPCDEMEVEVDGAAIYHTYHRGWGDMVFGFAPDGGALRQIVLSAEPPPPVRAWDRPKTLNHLNGSVS